MGPRPFATYANGSWGYAFVTVFFILSGATLYYSNPNIDKLTTYYKKRAKAILSKFYAVWLYCYFLKVLQEGSFLYKGFPFKFVLSALAMDGYFNGVFKGYYQIGEWFLGALVILYIIYPILLKMVNKIPVITFIFISGIWIFFTTVGNVIPSNLDADELITGFVGIPSCCFSFIIGMLIYT